MNAESMVRTEQVMGTVFSLTIYHDPRAAEDAAKAAERARRRLNDIDLMFSTWNPESPMSRLRSGRLNAHAVPDEIRLVLHLCAQLKIESAGFFDPWALPGGVDPTGLVKGWAVERALGELRIPGIKAAIVNGGGDIAMFGSPPIGGYWRVGIRHPWRPQALAGIVLTRSPVATSGTYERGNHLVNPRRPGEVSTVASATVIGRSLAFADAFATAIAAGGVEAFDFITTNTSYEAYLVELDGNERQSPGIEFAKIT